MQKKTKKRFFFSQRFNLKVAGETKKKLLYMS